MSCERQADGYVRAIAGRAGAGISGLASKRGFYAGLALGGAGLVGAGLVAAARRRSKGNRQQVQSSSQPPLKQLPQLVKPGRLPELETRRKVEPLTRTLVSERCAGCQTPGGSKPGAWYSVKGKSYCPDCAPQAADQAGLDLVAPRGEGASATVDRLGNSGSATDTGGTRPPAIAPLSPERRVKTKLAESDVGIYIGDSAEGKPLGYRAKKGYVVLRSDGRDTGLAVTPGLKVAGEEIREDTGRWNLLHINSGKTVPGAGPYGSPEEARLLASVLAQQDWTRNEEEFGTNELRQISATVTAYNKALAEQKAAQIVPGPKTDYTLSRRLPEESVEGKLIADGYGGVARVLEDGGEKLFVINSLGERYEVPRHQTRTPDEADFEGVRIAMPMDPARNPKSSCGLCGRSAGAAGSGEKWCKMNWQAFCPSCSSEYAAREAYGWEEEIGDAVELGG